MSHHDTYADAAMYQRQVGRHIAAALADARPELARMYLDMLTSEASRCVALAEASLSLVERGAGLVRPSEIRERIS